MGKNLGSVELYDYKGLESIANGIGFSTDLESDLRYLDADVVWEEAEAYMVQVNNSSAEVRITGTDYITIWR